MTQDSTVTLHFFIGRDGDYADRADSRVDVLDYDEVSQTSRVQFTDGTRAVVRARDLVSREVAL